MHRKGYKPFSLFSYLLFVSGVSNRAFPLVIVRLYTRFFFRKVLVLSQDPVNSDRPGLNVNVIMFKKIYKNTFTVNFSWSQCEISAGGGNSTAEYCIIICKGQIKIPLPLQLQICTLSALVYTHTGVRTLFIPTPEVHYCTPYISRHYCTAVP